MKHMPNYEMYNSYMRVVVDGIVDELNERDLISCYTLGKFERSYVTGLLIYDEDNNRVMDCFEANLLEREAIVLLIEEVIETDKAQKDILSISVP